MNLKMNTLILLSLLALSLVYCQKEIQLYPKPPSKKTIFDGYINNKLDMLIVIGNTGGTEIRQIELVKSATSFVNNLFHYKSDFQIAVIVPDMTNSYHQGKFQKHPDRGPAILNSSQLAKSELISYLQKQIRQGGSFGPPAQMGLEVMRKALSPELIKKENKGFLRQHSLLTILFVNYRDDCSFKYDKQKSFLTSYMPCYLPKSISHHGESGLLEDLYPVSSYIDFLQGLRAQKHRVMVAGIIGDPNQHSVQNCVEPRESCKANDPKKTCMHSTPSLLSCGGCQDRKARAYPGFRYSQLIHSISGEGYWFSICSHDPQSSHMEQTVLNIITLINEHLYYIVLNHSVRDTSLIDVYLIDPKENKLLVPQASKQTQSCQKDIDCRAGNVCGVDRVCYDDGWVYFPATGRLQPKIKLSGKYKTMLTNTTRILVQSQE